MAVFLPSHGMGNPAERATRAGLAMRQALTEFNHERTAQGLFPIDIGVGIATGEILMGRMGREDDRQEFVLTGRTVNRAALMEKQSKAGRFSRVILCPATVAGLAHSRPVHELSALPDGTVPCEIVIPGEETHA
jgi:adenylate cyclase